MRHECTALRSEPVGHPCPWQHLGLAPGFLELIRGQGRAWAREYELGRTRLDALFALSTAQYDLLRHHTEAAVAAGVCSRTEGLMLLTATCPHDDTYAVVRHLGEGSWFEEAFSGSEAKNLDEPEMVADIIEWPLQPCFPREPPPPGWQQWQRLAVLGTLAAVARKVLGSPLRPGPLLPGIEQPEEAPR